MGTRGHAGKSDAKKLSLAFDIDAQGDTPSLECRRMLTASEQVYFSQPGEPSDETRTHREVSKIAKQNLSDDSSDTGQDVSLTFGGTMAPTQPSSPQLEDGEVPEAYTPLSTLVPISPRGPKTSEAPPHREWLLHGRLLPLAS